MSETLWIKLTAEAESGSDLPWARLDANGQVLARGRNAPDDLPVGLPCRLVVSAGKVLWTRLRPPGRRRLEGAALAYALEEQLADSPESVHAVMGAVDKEGWARVAVLDQAWFADCLARLDKAGLRPVGAVAEPELVPGSDTEWHLFWGEQALLRLPDGLCLQLAADAEAICSMLNLTLEQSGEAPERIVLHLESGHGSPDLTGIGVVAVEKGSEFDWAAAAQAIRRPELELLQGRFARRGRGAIDLGAWRPALWLALVLVVVNLIGLIADSGLKVWQVKHINLANRARLRAAFPEVRVIEAPVLQMRRQLAALDHKAGTASATDFLPMLKRAGEALPASVRSGVREIRYRPGQLKLLVPAGASDAADWRSAGLNVVKRASKQQGFDELDLELGS